MGSGAQYVVASYAVILFALVVYVVMLGLKAARMARETELLARLVEREDAPAHGDEEDAVAPPVERAER